MSELKFTPGPWRVVSEWIDDGDGSEVEIFSVSGPNPDDLILDQPIYHADAKLIAAAPELLEALQELRSLMQGVIDGDYDPDSVTLQVADYAIAKATA
ncbi:hypothetical protein [Pseudomonas sp. CCI2.4]|uniref:hypothetical protein n=1 Tax=Pseudomonas sp. CCI2.4 TaxID=3048617 RepID=UPI002B22E78F|nr:hypothetical protein [Pseudomonas sp. CCI2.4]MEB0133444.1 hypothetical protein [Pseudomonas sp. CCI2.4]